MPDVNIATRPITLAIMAMGGQGGGVLSDWIVHLAESNGYLAQATSVPGVAQRTGATIYYLELFPEAEAQRAGQTPVLALMPSPGDVDIVLAAEFMEAGRALERGLVTPDRTTVIASSHRVYGITEKSAMGDGILDPGPVREQLQQNALRFIEFDMEATARRQGSVISAVLLGALAGSQTLPFPREAFEQAIRDGGIGVTASLRAFEESYRQAQGKAPHVQPDTTSPRPGEAAPRSEASELVALKAEIDARFPEPAREVIHQGALRLIDYQDAAYASEYLALLQQRLPLLQQEACDHNLLRELARHLALWLSYEDTIRVADLKIRRDRANRVRSEVKADPDQIVYTAEFMHPRVEEICDTLPPGLGRWVLRTGWVRHTLAKLTERGRRLSPQKVRGFLLLMSVASLRRWRRKTLRYREERQRIDAWLSAVDRALAISPEVALEVIKAQGLIKGYGDTHRRGLASFNTLMQAFEHHGDASDAATRLRQLRSAALSDEKGETLKQSVGEWQPTNSVQSEEDPARITIKQL
ncbi:indolepyruvate oxidoreductase subunit B [Billgrantia desiderata SP1]|uniref:indolepyruvate oxidoreductase subunit beta family protein n=1 Tax=Billgrantia desiderata TaxID=52021 RepID=UPI000B627A60|nr:indolepyruvate oxidoreductase subunit beta family protein [Halomonas desiderata]MCE8013008.1 indolepyruvate oxidoreductase subunit beta family protein [Halomonas desiderata]OUE39580.1 indolepyruvate oxidoreductase subunit B [Halomonas desiderata SP1]